MIDWTTLKQHKWIVAVSGGADSFALLAMCMKAGMDIICAHVNYQKRDSANRDMLGVKTFCEKHNIPFSVHMVAKEEYETKQNFQALARDIRYRFFRELVDTHDASGVLVAHHKDDVIETYEMQKRRKSIPSYYGIAPETELLGMKVKRILLDYTKKQLEEYCNLHEITYYEDESNFMDTYTRNKIRHTYVESLSESDKDAIICEIKEKNKALALQRDALLRIVDTWSDTIAVADMVAVEKSLQPLLLREWILRHSTIQEVHQKNIQTLLDMLLHKHKNFKHSINGMYFLQVEYGRFMIVDKQVKSFSFTFDEITYIETKYFTLAKEGTRKQGVTLYPEDFPICIRNAQKEDKIKLRMGTKKVSRMFIDNKISHKERELWPVVVNCKGNVIFVHKIGCDIEHYSNKSTMFVLK